MKLADYIRSSGTRRLPVVGIGVSNTPLIELLLDGGCEVTACVISPSARALAVWHRSLKRAVLYSAWERTI